MFNRLKLTLNKFLGNSIPLAGVLNWIIPGEWTKNTLIKHYKNVVYPVVSAIAEDAAKVELYVMRGESRLANHPFLQILKKPNPDYSQFQFLELHFTYMKLVGESYWYILKGENSLRPREFHLLRPDLMQVVVDKDDARGLIKGYQMTKPDGTKIPFDKDEVIQFKMPNPNNPYYGLSPIMAGKTYVETEEHTSDYTRNSIYNSGRPSGIVNLKGTVDEDQFKKLKRQFKEEYSGTENAGKTLLLKGMDGIDFQKLGMELGEVALREIKDMNRDDIMMMYRVSKTMIGISDDVNRANAQENHSVFYQNIIKPELDRFIDQLNAFVLPNFGNEDDMLMSEDPDLQTDKEKLDEWTQGHNKWLTTNEIRAQRGLDPIEGGDVLYQGLALVPMGEKLDFGGGGGEDKGLKKKFIRKSKIDVFKELTVLHQDAWIKKYEREMRKEFDTQLAEILARNEKALFENWSFDIDASKKRIVGSFFPMGVEIMREAAKFALDVADDEDTQFEINQRVVEYVTERTVRFAKATNDETVKKLDKTIAQGIAEGENIAKLKRRVKQVYEEANDIRAERIARTESIAASNEGANEAYRQSPLVNAKEWSTNYGACPICMSMNGKIVGLDESYFKLGQTITAEDGTTLKLGYEDINHPPVHPNCRCALLPVIIR